MKWRELTGVVGSMTVVVEALDNDDQAKKWEEEQQKFQEHTEGEREMGLLGLTDQKNAVAKVEPCYTSQGFQLPSFVCLIAPLLLLMMMSQLLQFSYASLILQIKKKLTPTTNKRKSLYLYHFFFLFLLSLYSLFPKFPFVDALKLNRPLALLNSFL